MPHGQSIHADGNGEDDGKYAEDGFSVHFHEYFYFDKNRESLRKQQINEESVA